ncbi:MAG: cobD [Actinomycetia bacterium]|nr:cobD [Actinomycetes bacterium]
MVSVAVGLLADRVLGEPPTPVHPVAAFGSAMGAVERRLHRDSRLAGVAHAAIGLGLGVAAGRAVRSTAVATYVAVAGRMLATTATEIGDALAAGDLEEARRLLPSLVGRDPSELDEGEIARAVVESVAENTVDAIVAPACWAAVAGAPGVLAHRAANTMDAMVGHRSERYRRYGWAAARLDDAMAWVPARVTAGLVAAVRPSAAGDVWRTVRRDAPAHPSPNSGVAEAAFAAALGVRLGGMVRYGDRVEDRPRLGAGRPVTPADIPRAVALSRDVTLATAVLTLPIPNWRRMVDRSVHHPSPVRRGVG